MTPRKPTREKLLMDAHRHVMGGTKYKASTGGKFTAKIVRPALIGDFLKTIPENAVTRRSKLYTYLQKLPARTKHEMIRMDILFGLHLDNPENVRAALEARLPSLSRQSMSGIDMLSKDSILSVARHVVPTARRR